MDIIDHLYGSFYELNIIMFSLQDRTLELLFSGAKKSIKPFQADPNENLIEQPSFENEPMDQGIPDKPASDQMIFNNKGHLVKPNPTCTQGRKDDSLGETTGAGLYDFLCENSVLFWFWFQLYI